MFAAGLCAFLNLYATQALLPTLAAEFGVTPPQTAWTITSSLLAVAAVAPFAGSAADVLGRKRVVVAAGLLSVAPILLAGTSGSLAQLVAWRFGQGLLLPFVFAVTVAYINEECPPPEAIRVTGHYALGSIVGGFSGRLVAGFAAEHGGWRFAFVALALLTGLAALVIAAALPAERRFVPVRGLRGTAAGFAAQFRNPRVLATCAVGFAVLFSMVTGFTYVNFVLAAPPFGLSPAQLGSVFAVYLTGLVATPVGARAAIRFGRRATLAGSSLLSCTGALVALAPVLPVVVVGLAMLAVGVFIEQMLSIGFVAAASSRSRSTAVGLYVTCYYLGGSLGAVLPAGVWHAAGWPGCVALVIAVQAAAAILAYRTWREPAA